MDSEATHRCTGASYAGPMECAESDCSEPATVRLHVPWAENREVCAGHARVLARRDGVVADPIGDGDDWP